VIRLITNSRKRDTCRQLFKALEVLLLYSQYIFSLPIFVIRNKQLFYTNNQIHCVHTTFKTNLHQPIADLTTFKKSVYYSRITISNNLPHTIKLLANQTTQFRDALKRSLLIQCFCNTEVYFN